MAQMASGRRLLSPFGGSFFNDFGCIFICCFGVFCVYFHIFFLRPARSSREKTREKHKEKTKEKPREKIGEMIRRKTREKTKGKD